MNGLDDFKEQKTFVHENDLLIPECDYKVGDLIKFKYIFGNEEQRYSYSKIERIVIKVTSDNKVNLHFITENRKFFPIKDIVGLEKREEG